eukprot:m.156127 g.156127  ORF g.156127 m.156127 type:complete len:903 (+) comp14314_c0_seq1:75-2783(+)
MRPCSYSISATMREFAITLLCIAACTAVATAGNCTLDSDPFASQYNVADCADVAMNGSCTVVCNVTAGFVPSKVRLQCGEDGAFNATLPSCEIVDPCDGVVCREPKVCEESVLCSGGECKVFNKPEGTFCKNGSGLAGGCTRGICIPSNSPRLMSDDGNMVFMVPMQDAKFQFGADRMVSVQDMDDRLHAGVKDREAIRGEVASVEAALDAAKDELVTTATSIEGMATAAYLSLEGGLSTLDEVATERIDALSQLVDGELVDLATADADLSAALDTTQAIARDLDSTKADISYVDGKLTPVHNKLEVVSTQTEQAQAKVNVVSAMTNSVNANKADKTQVASLSTSLTAALSETDSRVSTLDATLDQLNAYVRAKYTLYPLSDDVPESEIRKLAIDYCHSKRQYYDAATRSCKACYYTYDVISRRCSANSMVAQYKPDTTTTDHCSSTVYYNDIFKGNKLYFNAHTTGTYEIVFTTRDYLYGQSSCYGDNEAFLYAYLKLDGTRKNYCQQNYIRGWSRYDNQHQNFICRMSYTLTKGMHTIDFDQGGRGLDTYLYGGQTRSILFARYLAPGNLKPAAETKTGCVGTTSSVLVNTYLRSDSQRRVCGGWGYYTIDSLFNQAGPWTVRSTTGRIRIYFKAMTYVYANSGCRNDAGAKVGIFINGARQDYCDYSYLRRWYNHDNQHDFVVCDVTYSVPKGSDVRISLEHIALGQSSYLYGNADRSHLLIEDMPIANPSPPAELPTGCKHQYRRIFFDDYLRNNQYIQYSSSERYTRISGNAYTFTIRNDGARVRIYFKAMMYLYGTSSYYGDREAYNGIYLVIDGTRESDDSHWTYIRGWSYNKNKHIAGIVDTVRTFNKGTHKVEFDFRTRGYNNYLYAGKDKSHIIIEELPLYHDQNTLVNPNP